jgi:hypothetical protein
MVQARGFRGATFASKRNGSVAIYHTENLKMSSVEFQEAAILLVDSLKQAYPALSYEIQEYIIGMPQL